MAKNNIRSVRFSDEMIEIINQQIGDNFTQKFERTRSTLAARIRAFVLRFRSPAYILWFGPLRFLNAQNCPLTEAL